MCNELVIFCHEWGNKNINTSIITLVLACETWRGLYSKSTLERKRGLFLPLFLVHVIILSKILKTCLVILLYPGMTMDVRK